MEELTFQNVQILSRHGYFVSSAFQLVERNPAVLLRIGLVLSPRNIKGIATEWLHFFAFNKNANTWLIRGGFTEKCDWGHYSNQVPRCGTSCDLSLCLETTQLATKPHAFVHACGMFANL